MAAEETDDESHIRLDENQGSIRFRPGKQNFPKQNAILMAWFSLNKVLGKVGYQSWEQDPDNHQIIIYLSKPGFHTTKTVKTLKARVKELEDQLSRAKRQ